MPLDIDLEIEYIKIKLYRIIMKMIPTRDLIYETARRVRLENRDERNVVEMLEIDISRWKNGTYGDH